jgi:hypothetical protein
MTIHSKSLQVIVNHLCIPLNGMVVAPVAFLGYFEFLTSFYEMLWSFWRRVVQAHLDFGVMYHHD